MNHLRPAAGLVALWTASLAAASDFDPQGWLALQGGTFTGNTLGTGQRAVTRPQYGLRLGEVSGVGLDLGVLWAKAGWLIDAEFSRQGRVQLGQGALYPMITVGVPVAYLEAPFAISGVDVTLGLGAIARYPVGPLGLEARAQISMNFLSYMRKLYNRSDSQGHDPMLFYRAGGGVWIPVLGQSIFAGVRRDYFKGWWMNAAVVGVAF